ncbi:MAG: PD-(D/E)XK nuclease family protein [FCB group bacterium]|nr:PD-(D/E)XK nuclease family protein [FCB group bacterium]
MLNTYSYSALESYRSCPRLFKFAYIEKVSVPKKVNAITYLGSAVHRSLQQLYKLGADGILYPLEDLLNFYDNEWKKLNPEIITISTDYYTVDDYIRIGKEMLKRYYERYQPFNQGILLGTELSLHFQLPGTLYKFRGYIDRLWKRDDGVVEICDYKTGQTLVRPHDPRFLFQMGLYQLAVQESYPQFDNIELAQYFLRKDEVVSYKMLPEELEILKENLRQAVLATIQATRLDNFPPKEGGYCQFCDYFDLCPAKRHKKIIEEFATSNPSEGGADSNSSDEVLIAQEMQTLADDYIKAATDAKELKNKMDSLKADIIEKAKEYNLTAWEGTLGQVKVHLSKKEKFITKTEDASAFAQLTNMARQLHLDDYFILDANGLMKGIYQKKILPEEQLALLKPFVVEKEGNRVTVKLKHETDRADENN